jgi:hypothetical protein
MASLKLGYKSPADFEKSLEIAYLQMNKRKENRKLDFLCIYLSG